MQSLFEQAYSCIMATDPQQKVVLTQDSAERWSAGGCDLQSDTPVQEIAVPGRPARPLLVHPAQVGKRKLSSPRGRAAFLHALAHIEFNAINLAWDAVYRFREMPPGFYDDWVRVAHEEALHFGMLRARLQELGHDYGDFTAHNGLWDMARRTAHDVLVRMALVPRVLEARGLDVTPAMRTRLQQVRDTESAAILARILADEIGHVEIGSRWFRYICRQRGLEPVATFRALLLEYLPGRMRKPLNDTARLQAGFDREELQMLEQLAEEGL